MILITFNFYPSKPQDTEQFRALLQEEETLVETRNLNTVLDDGWTILHAAAALDRAECVSLLLKSGRVDLAGTIEGQLTALHVACARGHHEVVEVICAFLHSGASTAAGDPMESGRVRKMAKKSGQARSEI